jgi:hypothetical protein
MEIDFPAGDKEYTIEVRLPDDDGRERKKAFDQLLNQKSAWKRRKDAELEAPEWEEGFLLPHAAWKELKSRQDPNRNFFRGCTHLTEAHTPSGSTE